MDAAIRRLRSTAQQLARRKHPTAVRYPAPFRDAVITLARTRVAHGQSLARVVRLTMSELQLFLEGSTLVGRVPLSPPPFVLASMQKNLASSAPR